jgi:hypothetical protein
LAFIQILGLIGLDVLSAEELKGFSPELRERLEAMLT